MSRTSAREWNLADAKARFSEVVRRAREEGPQAVTRHGEVAVYVVSAEGFREHGSDAQELLAVMRRCPHPDLELESPKIQSPVRDIDW